MKRRGQSLVLWVMCLLLLALLVVMNLSIADRTRDRMRLQELADVSAYDQAVLTARYFNALSVLNRARAADGVALAGQQAVVSYASMMRSAVSNARAGLTRVQGSFESCCRDRLCRQRGCACSEASEIGNTVRALDDFVDTTYGDPLWQAMDRAAHAEFYDMYLHQNDLDATQAALADAFRSRGGLIDSATRHVLETADPGGWSRAELRAPFEAAPAGSPPLKPWERSLVVLDATVPAVVYDGRDGFEVMPILGAVMAGRQTPFVVSRFGFDADLASFVARAMGASAGSAPWAPSRLQGASAFGADLEASTTHAGARNANAMSHEHARVNAWAWKNGAACIGPDQPDGTVAQSTIDAHLITSSSAVGIGGEHVYERGLEPFAAANHTIGALTGVGMFGPTSELNLEAVEQESMLFGQPLLPALVERDLTRVPRKPWDFALKVRFSASGPGASFDTDKRNTANTRQLAMAGGLAYYHRAARLFRTLPPAALGPPPPSVVPYGQLSSWQEPANLWNPFWRAAPFLSGQGPRQVRQRGRQSFPGDDRVKWLDDYGFREEARALQLMTAAGYRGTR